MVHIILDSLMITMALANTEAVPTSSILDSNSTRRCRRAPKDMGSTQVYSIGRVVSQGITTAALLNCSIHCQHTIIIRLPIIKVLLEVAAPWDSKVSSKFLGSIPLLILSLPRITSLINYWSTQLPLTTQNMALLLRRKTPLKTN